VLAQDAIGPPDVLPRPVAARVPVPVYVPPGDTLAQVLPGGTVGESYARGIADIIRSRGRFNLDTSLSAINWQTARGMAQENWLGGIDAYFQGRMANNRYREILRGPRLTLDGYLRLAQVDRPRRLTSSELDPITGRILWPIVLQLNSFASLRDKLEVLFAERAEGGGVNAEAYLLMNRLSRSLHEELKAHIYDIPAEDYVAARNFIESLAYEATITPQFGEPPRR
jgi:hypothetical protein